MRPPPKTERFDVEQRPNHLWIDWIRLHLFKVVSKDNESGTTGERPVNGLVIGSYYFDTTLGHQIWYDGTNWVDATGATV